MTADQHTRLSAIVGCGSEDGYAEVDQVEIAYSRLRQLETLLEEREHTSTCPGDYFCVCGAKRWNEKVKELKGHRVE